MSGQRNGAPSGEWVLLACHGSKDPEGVEQALAFGRALEQRLAQPVQLAFLEFNEPSIAEGMRRCVAAGAARVTIVPLFLGAATHQKNDVPAAVAWAREQFPGVRFAYGTPLGTHAALAEALRSRALEALDAADCVEDEHTAVLLVGRGSRDPDSNSDLYKIGRLLYENAGFGLVEACYIAVTPPDLETGIERCVRLGARCVIAVPFMLFTGVLVKRMAAITRDRAMEYPGVTLLAAEPLGSAPRVLDVVEQRVAEARSGDAAANCDACKYRVRMSGFAHEHGLPQGSDHHHGLRGIAH